jgi:hypothetical protein
MDSFACRGGPDERVRHFAFEEEAIIKNDIGAKELGDVSPRWLVEVGVDPLTHQTDNLRLITRHLTHDIGNHPHRRDDLVLRGFRSHKKWQAKAKDKQ